MKQFAKNCMNNCGSRRYIINIEKCFYRYTPVLKISIKAQTSVKLYPLKTIDNICLRDHKASTKNFCE